MVRSIHLGLVISLLGCGSPNSDPGGDDTTAGSGGNGGAGVAGSSVTSAGSSGSTAPLGAADQGGASTGGAGTSAQGGHAGTVVSDISCAGSADAGASAQPTGTPPELEPGVWKNITPAGLDVADTFGTASFAMDPSHPYTLYLCADQRGMWKTTDGGTSWVTLGDPGKVGLTATSYLDAPSRVVVDPCNSNHLYATQGVRGATLGFWVSQDGGSTWVRPKGFNDVAKTTTGDVTTLAVDPSDFRHILVGSHSWWPGLQNGGILESSDGGDTWVVHQPVSAWSGGSMGINFLYDPAKGIGDNKTWLVTTDGTGFYRTTDSGEHWTKVGTLNGFHGALSVYYTKEGVLYSGANQYPARSTDNGVTWEQLTKLPYAQYFGVQGDGKNFYASPSCACTGAPYNKPFFTSPESDGLTWTPYQGGAQTFGNGPNGLRLNPTTRVLYAADWDAGFWALRVVD